MRNVSKVPATLFATGMAALLLGCMVLPNTAQAGVELSSDKPSYSDKLAAVHNSFGKDVVVRSDFSIDEMEKLQSTVKNNSVEIENLKKIIKDQARLIEELKRSAGSSSSASDVSCLKREVSDQDRSLGQLKRTVEELSRKVK